MSINASTRAQIRQRAQYLCEYCWNEHFIWSSDRLRIVALSSTGRATCKRLDINDDEHDEGAIRKARRLWIKGGWHPPNQDLIQLTELL